MSLIKRLNISWKLYFKTMLKFDNPRDFINSIWSLKEDEVLIPVKYGKLWVLITPEELGISWPSVENDSYDQFRIRVNITRYWCDINRIKYYWRYL